MRMDAANERDRIRRGRKDADLFDRSFLRFTVHQVYLPCVLQSKKRYVGFKYENPDDLEPVFDDKGIETVRRDGVSAQQKQLETSIKSVPASMRIFQMRSFIVVHEKHASNASRVSTFWRSTLLRCHC